MNDDHELILFTSNWTTTARETAHNPIKYDRKVLIASEQLIKDFSALSDQAKLIDQTIQCVPLNYQPSAIDQEGYVTHGRWLLAFLQEQIKRSGRCLVQILLLWQQSAHCASLYLGLLRTLKIESNIDGQILFFDDSLNYQALIDRCIEESRAEHDSIIRFSGNNRQVHAFHRYKPQDLTKRRPIPWRNNSTYVISGGMGGIGLLIAADIIKHVQSADIVLLGRSPYAAKQKKLMALQAQIQKSTLDVTVHYWSIDINDANALSQRFKTAYRQSTLAPLKGVFHCAGVINDGFLINKKRHEIEQVLAPKIKGLHNLHKVTCDQPLDFFIGFSSLASITGNIGQAEYAYANGYLDSFIQWRCRQVSFQKAHGKSLSINWPLWADGGMLMSQDAMKRLYESSGIVAMQEKQALNALYLAMNSALYNDNSQIAITYGNGEKCYHHITGKNTHQSYPNNNSDDNQSTLMISTHHPTLVPQLITAIKNLFAQHTGVELDQIDAEERFEMYGIDSIMVARLNDELAVQYTDVPQSIFYQCPTIYALAEYLAKYHEKNSLLWLGNDVRTNIDNHVNVQSDQPDNINTAHHTTPCDAIAIIGMSGRFPQAKNLDEFWANLKAGTNCIGEIPSDRWPIEGFYVSDKQSAVSQGKSYSKWGGFLEGFADFDPLFFNISPKEALDMDPQERVFLENCYHTLQHAGITRSDIQHKYQGELGVFAGVTKTGFERYEQDLKQIDSAIKPRTSFSAVANRVSYFLDLKGPSIPVDTMCSSSLTAIHQACESLQKGECQMALAGGVNLYQHPYNYYELCASGMLSDDGLCRSFGEGGTGFVPGEGVASVLLKPLSEAEKDGDNICAVIRSSAINHGGHAQGFTVPNPQAQSQLIEKVLSRAEVSSEIISYVEAHGTGTQLGDPIEFEGLKKVFESKNGRSQKHIKTCHLGSVKSNIGHLEAAAGVSGLIKTVLQIQHQQLVPTLHAEKTNRHIDFNASPFALVQDHKQWPVAENQLRTALVSSFGAGGSNACVMVEEYQRNNNSQNYSDNYKKSAIVLSARTQSELHTMVSDQLEWLSQKCQKNTDKDITDQHMVNEHQLLSIVAEQTQIPIDQLDCSMHISEFDFDSYELQKLISALQQAFAVQGNVQEMALANTLSDWLQILQRTIDNSSHANVQEVDLMNMAYTLQTGREAMPFRLAMCVDSTSKLKNLFENFLNRKSSEGNGSNEGYYYQEVTAKKETIGQLQSSPTIKTLIERWMADHNYAKILPLWVKGMPINWYKLYDQGPSRHLHILDLPLYPFTKQRLWPADALKNHAAVKTVHAPSEKPMAEPVVTSSSKPQELIHQQQQKSLKEIITLCLESALMIDKSDISPHQAFADYGLDSILSVGLVKQLNEHLSIDLKTSALFDHPNVNQLSTHIESTFDIQPLSVNAPDKKHDTHHEKKHETQHKTQVKLNKTQQTSPQSSAHHHNRPDNNRSDSSDIAIIGMSGCFPGAENVDELWDQIIAGRHHITDVQRWPLDAVANDSENACTRGGFLSDIAAFDAMFFNISGVEATHMDPQQRIFLQQVWSALEDGGYAGNALSGRNCGIYVGCCNGDYQDLFPQQPSSQSLWGNMGSVIPSRIAYLLDLKGPALAIDTSCSSSLVAVHSACQDLRHGETDVAIAGGVFVQSTAKLYLSANKANMLSPSGATYSFDERADGFVPGEAAGVLLLKRLDDALADGDHIHAVIKGSGLNNDGATNGITAPSADSQAALLTDVYRKYNINVNDIDYIETHGTGTQLGDPIEFRALRNAFENVPKTQHCTLGSIKQNIGHTQFAAGVSGIIKVILSLKHQQIPAAVNFVRANKDVPIADSSFNINTQAKPWLANTQKTRLAGVSSFGASGTNAHIILAEPPIKTSLETTNDAVLIVLSARSQQALKNNALKLYDWCKNNTQAPLVDMSFTLMAGRGHFEHRLAVVVKSLADLMDCLIDYVNNQSNTNKPIHQAYVKSPENFIHTSIAIMTNARQKNSEFAHDRMLDQLAVNYVQGNAIDHAALFEGQAVKRLSLPTYCFAKDHYWVKPTTISQTMTQQHAQPLFSLERCADGFKVAFDQNAYVFEQHKVNGQKVLPGVMIVELLRSALAMLSPVTTKWSLYNLVWVHPVLEHYYNELYLKILPIQGGQSSDFELLNQSDTNQPKVLSQGSVDYLSNQLDEVTVDVEMFRSITGQSQWSAQQCYDLTEQQGLQHGPLMRALRQVVVDQDHAIAELHMPDHLLAEDNDILQPSILDSVILMSVAFLLDQNIAVDDLTTVPFMVEKYEILGNLTPTMWAKMPLPQCTTQGIDGAIAAELFDETGKLCIRMQGCYYRPVATKRQAELLMPHWKKLAYERDQQQAATDNDMTWLLSLDEQPDSALLEHLPVHQIIELNTNENQLQRYLADGKTPKRIIIFALTAMPDQDPEVLIRKHNAMSTQLINLIKMMVALQLDSQPLEWTLITQNAHMILNDKVCNPTAAGVHGLIGSMSKEFALWSSRIVDIASLSEALFSDIDALPISANSCTLAHRNGGWYQSELVPFTLKQAPFKQVYKKRGNYLVIGGAGGVGRTWSKLIAASHQVQLIWVGRTAINDHIRQYIEEIAAYAPPPIYIQADASDKQDMLACREEIKQFGTLNGIVHSAISLNDCALLKMDEEQFIKSSRSKVDISVRLMQCFDLPSLDFVVFFSSIQSFAKMPGQGNYAAGCTFEDSFNHYLITQGVNAKTINWGYWAQVGVVSSADMQQRMKKLGLLSLDESDLNLGMDSLLAIQAPQLAMVALTEQGTVETLNDTMRYIQSESHGDSIIDSVMADIPDQQTIVDEISAVVGDQMSAFDHEMAQLLFVQLYQAGLFHHNSTSLNEIFAVIDPLYVPWMQESIRVLIKHGYLQWASHEQQHLERIKPHINGTVAWQNWANKTTPLLNNPDIHSHIVLAETMMFALSEIIVGATPATDIMFPESSLKLVEGVYRDNKVADYFNQVLCESLVISIKKHLSIDPHKKIRILEVGAGTGGTAKRVFAALKPYQQHIEEYCYTDLSKAFLIHAEHNYREDAPYLRTCIFNADHRVTEQGIDSASYDVVIATNVIHATQNVKRSLKHIKEALLTNGLFLLNELNDNVLFSHLTFGLLEGWWNYDDPELRIVGSPALSESSWQQVLAELGFAKIVFAADKAHHLGQQLIMAESNGINEQANTSSKSQSAQPVFSAVEVPMTKKTVIEKTVAESHLSSKNVSSKPIMSIKPIAKQQVMAFLRNIVASTIEIPPEKMETSVSFERYGVDSLLVLSLINELRVHFTDISSVLLFEVNTLDLLSDYLMENNQPELSVALGGAIAEEQPFIEEKQSPREPLTPPSHITDSTVTGQNSDKEQVDDQNDSTADIAIVGMSARFADANNLSEFWHNISTAHDSIRPIAQDRADWQAYKGFNKAGFMDAVDEFDPLFFHLSPAEAEQMDPQERIFIQETYHCLEEAGYAPSEIGAQHKVGVYVGIMNSHYAPHAAFWSVANRASYLFDLKGPSMAIDTACSSSLTAVHLAVESLRSGSADMVIAGGVNVIVDPQHLQILHDMSLLSPEAKCKAFGKGGNGIAIGEGVGVLLLKPLKKAQADGDHIHAIIKGTALNAGGKSSSYTAPKASAQAQLLKDAWHNAGVKESDISYIEGHGTGTELGDPIEFEGLTQAFKELKDTDNYCYLGSVKTNIGHLESAAGIAGICKVVLQMQQHKIAPNLYSDEINPHIDMVHSPFQLVQNLQPWEPHKSMPSAPLTAGVNSFGAGGANAHVVLQEYCPVVQQSRQEWGQQIIVLSAQSSVQLTSLVNHLFEHLIKQVQRSFAESSQYFANLAWTLQTGRDVMPHRLAFVCDDLKSLINRLERYTMDDGQMIDDTASVVTEENTLHSDEAIDELVKTWAAKKSFQKIATLWQKGYVINWHELSGSDDVQKISLPVYPFANEKYWIADDHSNDHHRTEPIHVKPFDDEHLNNNSDTLIRQNHRQPLVPDVIDDLKNHVAELLKVPEQDIQEQELLENYGLDSVMVIKLMERLVDRYGVLNKTLIFEYPTLAEFAEFLTQHDTGVSANEHMQSEHYAASQKDPISPQPFEKGHLHKDIAIIGIAGRYPDADDLEQFWNNLSQGKDSVSTVPKDRWSTSAHFSGVTQKGGFIQNAQYFDAAFFNMLPADAELSDPQERLFVETVYHAIENSGYTTENLSEMAHDHGNNVGVYVGVMYEDYQLHGVEAYNQGHNMALSGSPASIANRVSYLFDFNGPSLAIDSMCSSSFSAIHLACQAIKNGDCSVAIAGGVNLTLHENKYRMLAIGGFSSRNGHCAAFGESGDGYVPAEGVGAVILKPLSLAEQDGDNIIGVIKATAVNHGGKSNGYTVPNAQAQATVIRSALSQSGIRAEDINYIEAHGTGTVLGDPIEIEGLMQSYGVNTGQGQCAVGSVKSNIGHCESAAGMASLTKVLLQMKHQQLVPSLHAQPRNPHIDFAATPFDVQNQLSTWQPLYSSHGDILPLRAGISSFGAGGVNSHMIIEQYEQTFKTKPQNNSHNISKNISCIVVLSARTQQSLSQQVRNLYRHLKNDHDASSIQNVCYTLQVGRAAFSHRLAFVVDSYQQCLDVLLSVIEEDHHPIDIYQSQVSRHQRKKIIQNAADMSLQQLAMQWAHGSDVLWQTLYIGQSMQRLALPGYPFERKAYWAPKMSNQIDQAVNETVNEINNKINDKAQNKTGTTDNHYNHFFIEPIWVAGESNQSLKRTVHQVIVLSDALHELKQKITNETQIRLIDAVNLSKDHMATVLELVELLKTLMKSTDNTNNMGNAIVQLLVSTDLSHAEFLSLAALVKSANQESANRHFQLIAVDTQRQLDTVSMLLTEAQSTDDVLRYKGHRQVRRLQRCQSMDLTNAALWQAGEVFVISGGAGGLGWLYTQAIVNQVSQATVVLLGRSVLSQQRTNDIQQLNQMGASVIYRAVDVTDRNHMQVVIDEITRQYGTIDHVIHSAGVLKDGYLVNKSQADMRAVMAPKIIGVKVLDEVTTQHNLRSFTCFSSIAGVTGNAGQCDYAFANGYLDGFAKDRNHMVQQQWRSGQTLSINWPLWASGGMQMDQHSQQLLLNNYGLAAMPSDIGISASLQAYQLDKDQVMIAYGDEQTIVKNVGNGILDEMHRNDQEHFEAPQQKDLNIETSNVEQHLLTQVAEILRVDESDVDVLLPLGEYGFDSISFTQLAANVSTVFDVTVQPSDIFSYPTIKELSGFIASQMQDNNHTAQITETFTKHPLIDHRSAEDLFSVTLNASENFLTDHIINGDQVFPGTAYIEMALAARCMIDSSKKYAVNHIQWHQMCVVNDEIELFLAFDDQYSTFKIYSMQGQETVLHATGEVVVEDVSTLRSERQPINITGLTHIAAQDCYQAFKTIGVEYGQSHQSIQSLWLTEKGVIAQLQRQKTVGDQQWLLDPMYLDGVLQTSLALLADNNGQFSLSRTDVPMSLASVVIDGPLPDKLFVHVINQQLSVDFILCDENGQVCGKLTGLKSYPVAFDHSTKQSDIPTTEYQPRKDAVAIIGMSGSFPQAENIEAFWENLSSGKDVISEVPADRWDWQAIYGDPLLKEGCTNIKWGGFMDNMSHFDYGFFGMSAKEAEILDPQQRLLMMHVYKAIEDAGYAPSSLAGSNTGLVIATVAIDYAFRLDQAHKAIGGRTALGNVASVGPNRMSYLLDIHGPSETVETACSSSLVALHRGVQLINNGESDMVIVGGINTISTAKGHIGFSQSGMLSPTGRCHAFSENADGYARGEGVGMLVLKSLSAAQADGDPIHGVILGTGVNHGGKANSLTSPNPKAQSELIASVMKKAEINPDSISFIESHGTGTRLGDPIEIDALKQAYQTLYESSGDSHHKQPHIAIGALKSHIGHLEMASGIAGVIKVLLQMKHKTVVGNLHCDQVNPYINFTRSPFYLNNKTQPWIAPHMDNGKHWPLRAGVSSFGFGGVNAHVVIENHQALPAHQQQVQPQKPELLIISAQSASSLQHMCEQLLLWIDDIQNSDDKTLNVSNMAWTLKTGRDEMSHRLACVVEDFTDVKRHLTDYIAGESRQFLFSGIVEKSNKNSSVSQPINDSIQINDKTGLSELAKQWVNGAVFDWKNLSKNSQLRTIHLPSYVFDAHKCWVELPADLKQPATTEEVIHNESLDESLLTILADELAVEKEHINVTESFAELGVDSIIKLQMVSRFNAMHTGVLNKDDSDFLLQTSRIAECLSYLKSIVSGVKNKQPDKALDEQHLIELLADFFEIDHTIIKLDTTFDELGIDSIGFIRFIAKLTELYPQYQLDKKSDELLLAQNSDQLTAIIHAKDTKITVPQVQKTNTEDGVSTLPTIKKIDATVKSNPINHVVERIEGTREGKAFAVGLLKVDESHPYFFDHPLDHVSGMHLAQAMSDVTKASYLNHHRLPQNSALLIKEVDMKFPNTCNKDDECKVVSRLLKSDDHHDYYDATITQNGIVVAKASLLMMAIEPNSIQNNQGNNQKNNPKNNQEPYHYDALVKPVLVNKHKQENALLTSLYQHNEKMRCHMLIHPDAVYYHDFTGQHVDSIVMTEAVRQSLRLAVPAFYPDFIESFEQQSQPYHSFLKDISLQLKKPVYLDKAIMIELIQCDLSETGSAKYFELSGDILYDDIKHGSFSVSALMMSDSLLKKWTTTQ